MDPMRLVVLQRRAILALAVVTAMGALIELAMLRHYHPGSQLVPWFILGLIILSAVALGVSRNLATVRIARVVAVVAVLGAARVTASLAEVELAPRLPALTARDEDTVADLDVVMRRDGIMRIKVFASDGTVIYSDEKRLIGQSFKFDEAELAALNGDGPMPELEEPAGSENAYESAPGQLVEVRQAMHVNSQVYLLEVYVEYSYIEERAHQTWNAFLWLQLGSLALSAGAKRLERDGQQEPAGIVREAASATRGAVSYRRRSRDSAQYLAGAFGGAGLGD